MATCHVELLRASRIHPPRGRSPNAFEEQGSAAPMVEGAPAIGLAPYPLAARPRIGGHGFVGYAAASSAVACPRLRVVPAGEM